MKDLRVLVFCDSFIGTKCPSLSSRIFEEYCVLSKKVKLLVISEDVVPGVNNNLSLVKVSKISTPFFRNFFQVIAYSLGTIKQRNNYDFLLKFFTPKI